MPGAVLLSTTQGRARPDRSTSACAPGSRGSVEAREPHGRGSGSPSAGTGPGARGRESPPALGPPERITP